MSLSLGSRRGLFGWLGSIFKRLPKDPISKNIYDAISVIERMITSIDYTRRSLIEAQEEHSRKAKQFANEGKKQYEEIFLKELEHIGGLLSMLEKTRVDLVRIKTRLSTIATMERPLRELPEVIEELRNLRPQVEKIMPQLTLMIAEVERKVQDVLISTNVPSTQYPSYNTVKGKELRGENNRVVEKIPPLPPEITPVGNYTNRVEAVAQSEILISRVKNWLIYEIKNSGGILDIGSFTRKYNVSKSLVFLALRELEREGKIKLTK